tara:strand:+ start:323 stop:535 length:213 start_codon:yes stop_codon:yes gene_type:complete
MNFATTWSRIERLLLVVAVVGSVIVVGLLLLVRVYQGLYWTLFVPAWLPYLSARIIGWIVQATLDEDNHF